MTAHTVENLPAPTLPKYVQRVGGALYFRRVYRDSNGKQHTRRHALPSFDDTAFSSEYARLAQDRIDDDMHIPELVVIPPRGHQAVSGYDLYVVQSGDHGPIKIGRSKNVHRRIQAMQTGHPVRLRLLAIGPGMGELEMRFHYSFGGIRVHSEWFQWHYAVRHLVLMLRNGQAITTDVFEDLRILASHGGQP
jgi:hypothetical protein